MPTANLISGVVLLAFSLVLAFVLIPMQVRDVSGAIISPRMLPNVCAALLGILSVLLIVGAIRERRDTVKAAAVTIINRRELASLACVVALTLIAIVVFRYLGAGVAGGFLTVALLLAAGERNPFVLIAMPCALIGAAWLLFYVVLGTSIQ